MHYITPKARTVFNELLEKTQNKCIQICTNSVLPTINLSNEDLNYGIIVNVNPLITITSTKLWKSLDGCFIDYDEVNDEIVFNY